MSNPDDSLPVITASEVNRYCYCPWQWYYEKIYGRTRIRQLCRERNEALGYNDSTKSAFARGRAFHDNYLKRYTLRDGLARLAGVLLAVLLAGLFIFLYVWLSNG